MKCLCLGLPAGILYGTKLTFFNLISREINLLSAGSPVVLSILKNEITRLLI